MAWSKKKKTIVGVAIALLGIAAITAILDAFSSLPATTPVIGAFLPAPDIRGTWEGTLDLPGSGIHARELPKTRLVVTITETNGAYQANLDVIDLAEHEVFDTFIYTYPDVRGEIISSDTVASVIGKVSRLTGKVTLKAWQNSYEYPPIVLSRTTHPASFPEPLTDADFVPRAGSALQGFWVGKIGRGKGAIHIQVKIAEASDKTFRADFYCPDQHAARQPTTVTYDGSTVKVITMAGYGMFEGWLQNGGKELVGNWLQGGGRAPTTLTQADYSKYEVQAAK